MVVVGVRVAQVPPPWDSVEICVLGKNSRWVAEMEADKGRDQDVPLASGAPEGVGMDFRDEGFVEGIEIVESESHIDRIGTGIPSSVARAKGYS